MCAQSLNHDWLCVTPCIVTCQAPLSMEFSRQECQDIFPKCMAPLRRWIQKDTAVIYIKQWPAYVFSFLCIRRQSSQYIATIYSKESFSSMSFFYFPRSRSFEEKAMATHSSTLAWKIPRMEEPGGLQSMGLWRIRQDWATSLSLFTFMHWRRKWQPTPVFLSGESQEQQNLVGCRLWGGTESDMTEVT